MSRIVFETYTGRLWLFGTMTLGPFVAANFVDSHSDGPWPPGIFEFAGHHTHPDDAPDSPFGASGILFFGVPNRTDMGVHSGRRDTPDGLGRAGPFHATLGCIRTTDAAMTQLLALHQRDPITQLEVRQWIGKATAPPAV